MARQGLVSSPQAVKLQRSAVCTNASGSLSLTQQRSRQAKIDRLKATDTFISPSRSLLQRVHLAARHAAACRSPLAGSYWQACGGSGAFFSLSAAFYLLHHAPGTLPRAQGRQLCSASPVPSAEWPGRTLACVQASIDRFWQQAIRSRDGERHRACSRGGPHLWRFPGQDEGPCGSRPGPKHKEVRNKASACHRTSRRRLLPPAPEASS